MFESQISLNQRVKNLYLEPKENKRVSGGWENNLNQRKLFSKRTQLETFPFGSGSTLFADSDESHFQMNLEKGPIMRNRARKSRVPKSLQSLDGTPPKGEMSPSQV